MTSSTPAAADPWAAYGPGTVFVQSSVMVTKRPLVPYESRATIRIEVLELLEQGVRVEVQTRMLGGPGSGTDTQTLARFQPQPTQPPVEDKQTSIQVEAGTFACRYRRWTTEDSMGEWTMELWDDPSFPFPYRTKVTGPRTTDVQLLSVTQE